MSPTITGDRANLVISLRNSMGVRVMPIAVIEQRADMN
jgi:hypothetical protein